MSTPILDEPYTHLRRRALATRCLHCGASLADARSAAVGLGPTCRRRMGLDANLKGNVQANTMIASAAIAAEEGRHQTVVDTLRDLLALDPAYSTLVEKVKRRLLKFRLTADETGYLVHSPYNPDVIAAFKGAGLRWQPVPRAWRAADMDQRDAAIGILAEAYPEAELLMPSGIVIGLESWGGV